MPELSIEAIFGTGTAQTATTFTISKSGLAAILTAAGYSFNPKADNSADELMAALICAGLVNLSPANREVDPINRNVELSYDSTINFDTTTLNGQTYNRHTVSVNFYKPIATPKLNPSDF
jgi:hypothetical protein